EVVHAVAPDVAHRNPRLLGILPGDLGQFLATLLVEFRYGNTDRGAVDHRVQAQIGIADRLLDGRHEALVPDLYGQHARFRDADGADLVHRHLGAVGVDVDRLEQARCGATGTKAAELLAQHGNRALHPAPDFRDIEFFIGHGRLPGTLHGFGVFIDDGAPAMTIKDVDECACCSDRENNYR